MRPVLCVTAVLAAGCFDFDRALVTCMQNGGCATARTLVVTGDGGMVRDLPLLVTLEPQHVTAVVNPATDLRFVDDATGDTLPFEVDHWDAGGPVWVRLPVLDGRATLSLFAGPNAGAAADAGAVWPGFELVHHFQPGLASSVDARYRGARVGGKAGAGVVGDGPYFTGSGDQRVDFTGGEALFDGWSAFTLAFWLYPDYPSLAAIAGEPGFLDKGGGLNLGRLLSPGGGARFQIDMHFTGANNDTYLGSGYGLRRWNFIVYTFDGERLTVYVDGVEEGMDQLNGGVQRLQTSNFEFFLGDRGSPINGSLDELWISQTSRDARWVHAVHQSVTGQLVTISP